MQTKCECALVSRERLPNPPSPLPPHSKRNARLTLKWGKKKTNQNPNSPLPNPKTTLQTQTVPKSQEA